VQTQYTYEPFGKATVAGATSANSFEYTGRENDSTGLYYYRARYYHPGLQRFISEDPLGFDGGQINLYGYVGNGPVDRVDPMGTSAYPIHWLETYFGAHAAGFSRWDAFKLGYDVAEADRRPGAQDADARGANEDGMGGALAGRGKQNKCEAYEGTADYARNADRAGATHAIQDSYPHQYASWDGGSHPFGIPYPWPGWAHFYEDWWYNDAAAAATANYLRNRGRARNPSDYLAPKPRNCN